MNIDIGSFFYYHWGLYNLGIRTRLQIQVWLSKNHHFFVCSHLFTTNSPCLQSVYTIFSHVMCVKVIPSICKLSLLINCVHFDLIWYWKKINKKKKSDFCFLIIQVSCDSNWNFLFICFQLYHSFLLLSIICSCVFTSLLPYAFVILCFLYLCTYFLLSFVEERLLQV